MNNIYKCSCFIQELKRLLLLALIALTGLVMAGCKNPTGSETDTHSDSNTTPVAADFTVSGLLANYDGAPKAVSITPKTGKSQGAITIWYQGTVGTAYTRRQTAPSAAGSYAVTFDVAAAAGFNVATGLSAGTLVIIEDGITVAVNFAQIKDAAESIISGPALSLTNVASKSVLITVEMEAGISIGAYRWYVNNRILNGENGSSVTLNVDDYPNIGSYSLMVEIKVDGKWYNQTLAFTVGL